MKNLNVLNKVFLGLSLVFLILFIYKVVVYKASERYYYTASVYSPEEFPIKIIEISFRLENNDRTDPSFYSTIEVINNYNSYWGATEYMEAQKPQFLPNTLVLSYIDYHTRKYYSDTILLPKNKMENIFKEAKNKHQMFNLNSWKPKMGLKYHVGIANEGNIIFWLVGKEFEKEFYRVQIEAKDLSIFIKSRNFKFENQEQFIQDLFHVEDKRKAIKFKNIDSGPLQYKDSIPKHFKNYLNNQE